MSDVPLRTFNRTTRTLSLSPNAAAGTLQTADDLQMTTSKDVLDALSEGYGPAQVFAALGYSAWSSGQLEDEIRNNSWLTVAADHALIFEVPFDERYDRAMLLLGVQPWALAFQAGTA